MKDGKINKMSNINKHFFEIHLTVNLEVENSPSKEEFICFCIEHGIKPIVIGFDNNIQKQVMTSDTCYCTLNEIYTIATTQAALLEEKGYTISRVKIESDPSVIISKPDYCYVEIHLPCYTDRLKENLNVIQNLIVPLKDSSSAKPHISKNEFKRNITFITYRSKKIKDFFEFDKYVYDVLKELKVLTPKANLFYEVCIYDTNKELDNDWMQTSKSLNNQYVLLKYDINLTTAIIYQIIEDNLEQDYIIVEDQNSNNSRFKRSSVLLSGTKEEMEAASIEHKQILEKHRQAKELHSSKLNSWLEKYQKK